MNNISIIIKIFILLISIPVSAQELQSNDTVQRAVFTTAINEREPVNIVGQLGNDVRRVYFFTEIVGMAGQTITHRWEHENEIRAEIRLRIDGDRWRVWSSKKFLPQWLGKWTVTVIDNGGNILATESMAYIPSSTN